MPHFFQRELNISDDWRHGRSRFFHYRFEITQYLVCLSIGIIDRVRITYSIYNLLQIKIQCSNERFNLKSCRLFLPSYYSTGVQICIEVTYPISEGISTAIMFLFVQILSVVLTSIYGYTCKTYNDLIANGGLVCIMIASVLLAFLIPSKLMRQDVENMNRNV